MKILLLGAGLVGQTIARDLAEQHQVIVLDKDSESVQNLAAFSEHISGESMDLGDPLNLSQGVLDKVDLVVNALPGSIGYKALETVIEAGCNTVDISFFPENALDLDQKAKDKGVTAIVDSGVAPGLDNLLLGYHNEEMTVERFECLVGGLPVVRTWPFEYKAPFSPNDVIDEYLRPARLMENGRIVTKAPLTDLEKVNFPGIGTLEAFNTDGLRSLLSTMPHIPNMQEKTLRFPGHAELISALKTAGFFDMEPIEIKGHPIKPVDLTAVLLKDQWNLAPGEEEFTVMRVTIEGEKEKRREQKVYHLFDRYDPKTGNSSMARTTAYTCTAMVKLLEQGACTENGIFPPELLGGELQTNKVLEHLEKRGIHMDFSTSTIP